VSIVKAIAREGYDTQHYFFCPACKEIHCWWPSWTFNGDIEKPTVRPSIKVTWPANPQAEERFKEWRTERICHSMITDGQIFYYKDSTHGKGGETMPIPDYPFPELER